MDTPKGKPRPPKPSAVSKRPDQSVAALTSMQHERLVGRAVMTWTKLDACLQGLLWAFLNLSMSDGRIITSRLDPSVITQMLRALAIRNLVPEKLQNLLDVLNLIDQCREDRNFIVHGAWVVLLPEGTPQAMSLRPKAEPGEIMSEAFPARRMYQIIERMEECRLALVNLEAEIVASREKLLVRRSHD
jgi:hypothetical protein